MRYGRSYSNYKKYGEKKRRLFFSPRKRKIVTHRAEALYNPFERRRSRISLIIFKRMLFPLLLALWVGLIFYLPYFRISHVTYSGLQILRVGEVEQAITEQFWQGRFPALAKNYFFVRESAMAGYLKERFALADAEVQKVFPNTLDIAIREKVSTIMYDDGKNYFLLDADGTAIKRLAAVSENEYQAVNSGQGTAATTTSVSSVAVSSTTVSHTPNYARMAREFGNYPIVYFSKSAPASEQQKNILKSGVIAGFVDAYNAIQRGRGVKVHYFSVDEPAAGAIIHTNQRWKIYFDPAGDIASQINNVNTVLRSNKPIEYIDVRYGERVYWK